jgi:type IV pilus assembly protein PilM
MLRFLSNWFGPSINPIGVDFGSDCLRLAQVQIVDGEPQLVAAASTDVPGHVRHDAAARLEFFVRTTRDLLAQGSFQGRQAVLALPAAMMFIQHLRLPRLDEEATRKALPWEARGKLPIDPSHAILRHLVAGEVYQDQEPRNEVILMAASRDMVHQLLDSAGRARLDVVGMNVEPLAVLHCFGHVYRRKSDAELTTCYVDIGCAGTRAVIARGQQVLFARAIALGGDHFTSAVANALKLSAQDAKLLRLRLAALQPVLSARQEKTQVVVDQAALKQEFALLGAGLGSTAAGAGDTAESQGNDNSRQLQQVEAACRGSVLKLAEELDLCRRYYEATFPSRPVDRLIFLGGEARHRGLCQSIAQHLGIAAQVGDPLVRMGRTSEVGVESGIDRRQPQPAWAVAIGLSLGPPPAPPAAGTAPAPRMARAATEA